MKPISLNHKILSLFKTPNPQRVLIPFAWSGSEVIWAIKAGFTDIEWCELNPEYVEIAKARIEYWSKKFKWEQTLF
jgi:DNA modification methylase